ncbi:MAG: glycosyltransferase family 4 protein [Actinomycetota bacterium]
MRIGLVCPYDLSKPGGVQAQVKDLARQLIAAGDEVTVLAPGLPRDLEGVDLGGSVTIPGNKSKVPLSPDPRVGRRIRRAVADLDLLHVHEPLMPFVSLGALRAGLPVVVTFHAAPGSVGKAFYKIARPWLRSLLGPNLRKVTAVSRTAAAPLPRDLGITIVPNGIDVEWLQPAVERHPRRVAFLGRDDKRKGLDVLLAAWDRIVAEVEDVELVVMGASRDVGGIKWLGRVDDDAKKAGLGSSAVYVAPNLGGESFGVVLVEAMAAGAAVVASDLPAFQEVGGDAVRYFETGNSADLAATLIELFADPDTMEAMARAGSERAWKYDWGTVAASYREVYEAALS